MSEAERERDNGQDSEAAAWRDLVQSPGWALARRLADEMHGPAAQLQQMDAALATVGRGDRDAADDTVVQIRARSLAVEKFLAAVEGRAKQTKAHKPKAFELLRRIPR